MAHPMSDQDVLAFLVEQPRTGHLATVRSDGRPHAVTIWYTVDGNDIVFVTSSDSVKARNLLHNPFAALTVDDPNPPYTWVTLEGPVRVSDDMDLVRQWAEKIAARYLGAEFAAGFVQMEGFPDDSVYRITPSNMTGLANLLEQ
jgi:PPOX class probable F420-dependent enzyme